MQKLYTCWENDPDIGFVAMKVEVYVLLSVTGLYVCGTWSVNDTISCDLFFLKNYFNVVASFLKGSGRAFCAGGDIVTLHHLINAGKYNLSFAFNIYLKKNLTVESNLCLEQVLVLQFL